MINPNVEPPAGSMQERLVEAIRTVLDPELPVNLYDLGLIYEIQELAHGDIHIVMTLTTPNCPVAELLPAQVQAAAAAVSGVGKVEIELTFEPAWSVDRLSEAAKLELEFTGYTGPMGKSGAGTTPLTMGRRRVSEDRDR